MRSLLTKQREAIGIQQTCFPSEDTFLHFRSDVSEYTFMYMMCTYLARGITTSLASLRPHGPQARHITLGLEKSLHRILGACGGYSSVGIRCRS